MHFLARLDRKHEMIDLRKTMSYSDIAKRFNISEQRASFILNSVKPFYCNCQKCHEHHSTKKTYKRSCSS